MNSLDAVGALSALAQDTRLAVFRLLVRDGDGGGGGKSALEHPREGGVVRRPVDGHEPQGICAGVIAEHLKVPPATLSFHLAKLEQAGLIKARRRSLNIYYSADHAGIRALLGFLTEDCCQGRPELCGVIHPEPAPRPPQQASP